MSHEPAPAGPLPPTAHRRYLSILFSDLSDSTRLAAAMEAEDYAELLAGLRAAYRQVVPRHGGIVVRMQGDGMLAIFGHPDAREDDGRRATEAALDLHERVRALQLAAVPPTLQPLALHSGIHAGLVLVDEGDEVLGRFELMGNAPNIAARLCEAARKDQILVSAEALGPLAHFFRTGEPQALALRGAAAPVNALLVHARAAVRTRYEARVQRSHTTLTGREPELATLQQALAALRGGEAGFAVVAGPPGLGKTRLAEALLQQAAAAGCLVLRGYCESYLSAEPLQPMRQVLRQLPAAPAAAEPAVPGAGTEPATAAEVAAALAARLRSAAAAQPLLLFIDDWQWADDASRQLLGEVRALGLPLLVLLAARTVNAGDPLMLGARVLELGPLDDAAAAAAVAQQLPGVDPFVAAEIRAYAGGNPLYLEELCHAAAAGHIDRRIERQPGGAWLDALVESRVGRLPPPQAEVLRLAAVIGNVVPAWLLERLSGCSADDALVRGLADEDFLYPDAQPGSLRFKHGLTRDAIYRAVGLRQREAMHLRIAQALAAHESAADGGDEALAYHYAAAGRAEDAARHAEAAGDRALAASALDRAQAQYRAALAALDSLPPSPAHEQRWSAVAQRLGLVCAFDPSRDHLDLLQRAAARAIGRGDAVAHAKAEHWLGYVHYGLGDPRLASRHCERAIAAAGDAVDAALLAQMRATLGQALAAAGEYRQALPLLDAAITTLRERAAGGGRGGVRPAVGLAYTLACRAALLGDRGEFGAAQDGFDQALQALHGVQHEVEASVLGWRAAVWLWQGRWAEAAEAARAAQRIAERVKSLYIYAMDQALAAQADWMLSRRPDALRRLQDATGWLEAGDRRLTVSLNHGWLTEAFFDTGERRLARHHAACALRRARVHDRLGLGTAWRALARAAMAENRPAEVERCLAKALALAEARESAPERAHAQALQAEWAARRGERSRAAALFDAACTAFEALDMAWHRREAETRRDRLRA